MGEFQEPPMVTLALFAYNQERFIREAVEAALSQDYARLEIILSDDCSKDDTFQIIKALASNYRGPHKIIVSKNPINLGLAKHFSRIVGMARGEIIVVAAGDDISFPNRVAKSIEILSSEPEANFVSFTDNLINEDGVHFRKVNRSVLNKITKVTLEDYIAGSPLKLSGASRAYRKKIFEVFGELNAECPTEDTPSILRGLMLGFGLVSTEAVIFYRQHETNLSGPASLHSMRFEEIRNQYLRDAEFALHAGLIANERHQEIKKWAEKNYEYRIFSKMMYESSIAKTTLIKGVISSKRFTTREKIGLLRRVLRGL
jgi:glycosyltransferase involved in cell wall biosynthesis